MIVTKDREWHDQWNENVEKRPIKNSDEWWMINCYPAYEVAKNYILENIPPEIEKF